MGEEGGGGGIYRSYCFGLVSSVLDPQEGTMKVGWNVCQSKLSFRQGHIYQEKRKD